MDFIDDFIVEIIVLDSEGLLFKNNHPCICPVKNVCDVPDRKFVTNVKDTMPITAAMSA